jgi:hypothetical protein
MDPQGLPLSKCNCHEGWVGGAMASRTSLERQLTGEDVLHRVGYNEVLVRDEAVDGLLVTLRHSSLLLACALDFCD